MNDRLEDFWRDHERATRPEADDGSLTSEIKGILRSALDPERAAELQEEDEA
jgi:hypothetical protein